MAFYGRNLQRFDAKNRVVIPKKFRVTIGQDRLRDGLVLTNGFDGCLYLFMRARWRAILESLDRAEGFRGEDARIFEQEFVSPAEDVVPDKTGRILVEGHQRQYAALGDEVLFVGANNRIEIWDAGRWAERHEAQQGRLKELGEKFDHCLRAQRTGPTDEQMA